MARKRKNLLAVIGALCAVIVFGTWGVLYSRSERLNEEHAGRIQAFNDSIDHITRLEEWRIDSIATSRADEERRCMIAPTDFIGRVAVMEQNLDPVSGDTVWMAVNRPAYQGGGKEKLIDKDFRIVHAKTSKEEAQDGTFFPVNYIVFERFFKDHGYMRVTYYEGRRSSVTVDFPDKEMARAFLTELERSGYGNTLGGMSISWPSEVKMIISNGG